MSLLDFGTVVAEVYVEEESTDEYRNKVMVPAEDPIEVPGRLQPSTTNELAEEGQSTDTRYRFISRTFPGGPYARVVVDGETWDVDGTPKHHTGSALTEHYTTILVRR
jgi:hypothetical protein